jgi:hypothetical protein
MLTQEVVAILTAGRRLEPIARFFRRVAGALCAVAVTEVAASINLIAVRKPIGLLSLAVYAFSAVASVLALADCVLAEQLVIPTEWKIPRLDDQFNTSETVATLSAVVLLVLLVGAGFVISAATRTKISAHRARALSQVRIGEPADFHPSHDCRFSTYTLVY